tara:strand:- start:307 stop:444 length:138 start_codon:yes stop_codon:yes gene_type:complete
MNSEDQIKILKEEIEKLKKEKDILLQSLMAVNKIYGLNLDKILNK